MAKKKSGIALIVQRNQFYRDGYFRSLTLLFALLILNGVLIFSIFYTINHSEQPPVYFPMSNENKLIQESALTDKVFSDGEVAQWAANVAIDLFSLDYLHWRATMQRNSSNFTGRGWLSFVGAMKASNNLKTLQKFKMVTDVQILGAPRVISSGVVGSVYQWKLSFPMMVSYEGTINQRQIINVSIVVVRVPLVVSPKQVAINMYATIASG